MSRKTSIFYTGAVNEKGNRKPRKWVTICLLSIVFLSVSSMIGVPLYNAYSQKNPIDKTCTIISAEVFNNRSGTGGLSTSSTELKIRTQECGTVYVSKVLSPSPARSWDEMAAELDGYRGQQVTLVFPPFQLPAEGDYALGYGYAVPPQEEEMKTML
ncbi:hypothetical protein [Rothia nasimurium]|uniref:hypothetical protein n=1 Tax=Rothia nasimurium TaxID=85336 RepID=UPI001F2972EF|nr:hypothetical protein [Rothia nasimurium]